MKARTAVGEGEKSLFSDPGYAEKEKENSEDNIWVSIEIFYLSIHVQ